MPETDFSRIGPQTGMDRVEGSAPVDLLAETRVVRDDPAPYVPLYVLAPGELPPAPEPPPAPPQPEPTEAEARQALADAIKARAAARTALDNATAAHERGLQHIAKLQREAAKYANLQAAIDEHITEALRLDGHAELPDELRDQWTARAIAATELASAQRVVEQLLRERAAATDAYRRTEWPVTGALDRVLDFAKAPLHEELRRVRLRAEALSQAVQRGPHAAPWTAVRDRLMADPFTDDLAIEIGDAPLPEVPQPPLTPVFNDAIKLMRSDGSAEVITHEEFGKRERARAIASGSPHSFAMREAEAIARARSGVGG